MNDIFFFVIFIRLVSQTVPGIWLIHKANYKMVKNSFNMYTAFLNKFDFNAVVDFEHVCVG